MLRASSGRERGKRRPARDNLDVYKALMSFMDELKCEMNIIHTLLGATALATK